jgi:hypothetical protein
MYEYGKPFTLKKLLEESIPEGLSGRGQRVWESFWVLDSTAKVLFDAKVFHSLPPADRAVV